MKQSRTHRLILLMIAASIALALDGKMDGTQVVTLWLGLMGWWVGGKGWASHVKSRGGGNE